MRHRAFIGGMVGILLLAAGCSSDGESPSPPATAPPATAPASTAAPASNAAACAAFADANNRLVSLSYNGKGTMTLYQWDQAKNDAVRSIDRASLKAQGAVKERIDTLVAQLPADTLQLAMSDSTWGRTLVTNEDRVDDACQADGHAVTINRLTVVSFRRPGT